MSDKVTMTAIDTLHISNVQADNLTEGDVFNVSEADAARLEKQGLAERGGTASKAVNADAPASTRPETREETDAERGAKQASAPANKAVAAPENKTISADSAASPPRRARKAK